MLLECARALHLAYRIPGRPDIAYVIDEVPASPQRRAPRPLGVSVQDVHAQASPISAAIDANVFTVGAGERLFISGDGYAARPALRRYWAPIVRPAGDHPNRVSVAFSDANRMRAVAAQVQTPCSSNMASGAAFTLEMACKGI